MSVVTVTNHSLIKENTVSTGAVPQAFAGSDTIKVPMTGGKNQVIRIMLEEAGNIVISKGNGLQGIADKTIALLADREYFITLESGAYMNVSGSNAGYAIITPAQAGEISVCDLFF